MTDKATPVKAGSFVAFDADNEKRVAVVIETSKDKYDDGSEGEYALIAELPTSLVKLEDVWAYGTKRPGAEAEITGSSSDTASSMG